MPSFDKSMYGYFLLCYNRLMTSELKERGDAVLSNVLEHYTDLEVAKGKGAYLFTPDGKKILDFASGIAVTCTGHCHPEVVKAAAAQAKVLIHNCAGVTYHEPYIAYLEKLKSVVPIPDARIFLTQSGSESVEGALKAAKYVSGKSGVIAIRNGFHGRTMGALSVTTSKASYTEGYGDLMPNSFIAEANLDAVKQANNGNIAAVITELVAGEGGYEARDKGFIQALRQYCTDEKILLIIDEVQTGFGRTGTLFCCEQYGIEPDILALAKAMATGYPLGAVVMKKEISEGWKTSAHGGTFTGNLVSCSAGSATIDILQSEIPHMEEKINLMNESTDKLIKKYPDIFVKRTGIGFMMGIQCRDHDAVKAIRDHALEAGLLIISSGADNDVLRVVPPVTVSIKEIKKAFRILKHAASHI